jgi:hypothetical protein
MSRRRVAIEFHAGRAMVTVMATVLAPLLTLTVLAGCSSSVAGSASAPPGAADRARFLPTQENPDPAKDIDGVEVTAYEPSHANAGQRVAYTKAPPDGGRHDPVWANCAGTVYPDPVRNEHMVHALEHGAVWIAYNADDVTGDQLELLADRVRDQPYLMLSPYPDLDQPISLQSWGHQLKLSDAADRRIDQFILALRSNQYTTPEPGAPCDTAGSSFDVTSPPPFEEGPPGPDAAPVDGP